MPETSLRSDEQIRRNIELAYIGLTLKGELVDAASLTKEVIIIGRMHADNSLAVLVQKSARLVGTIKDIKFEESSQRCQLLSLMMKSAVPPRRNLRHRGTCSAFS